MRLGRLHRRRALAVLGLAVVAGVVGLVVALLSPGPSRAALFVSPHGRDSGEGSRTAPLRTLTTALHKAPAGGTITLAPGTYPAATDGEAHAAPVIVHATGARIAGLTLKGAANVRIDGARFTGPVKIDSLTGVTRPPHDITLRDVDMSHGCLTIENRAHAIALLDSDLHDCFTGVAGPGRVSGAYTSSGIHIEHNLIERMRSDGIQFGDWNDVTIADNVIRDIRDPKSVIHNDAIQLTGGSRGVTIRRNLLSGSNGQLIFVQDAIRPIDGIRVTGNLATGAGAVAVQSQGATHATYAGNVFCGKDGGLWLRKGTRGVVPTDTVVTGNVLSSFAQMQGAHAASARGNSIGC